MAFSKAFDALPQEWQAFLTQNELNSPVVLANLLPGDVPELESAPQSVHLLVALAGGLEFRDCRRIELGTVSKNLRRPKEPRLNGLWFMA